ncbi:putative protein OS=Streptomyces aurantiogriseus OX=66870 GN=GCM10010251_16410 PE=4 SV=1 [Streptomyces aurantiogriseus]|uniref:Uncharacterized protein n=1 Tax=Streptomyces aurantiogriseus TaxID=66870 RepID=A0A918C1V1_9ACTN|nr:hypothetical protein GCM10010251_16410 [Streptomyces aurantiogriseus]
MGSHLLARLAAGYAGARGCIDMRLRRLGAPENNAGADLSTHTQAPSPARPHAGGMLWSDPKNEPPKELRDMQETLRRLGLFLALAMLVAMIVLGVR